MKPACSRTRYIGVRSDTADNKVDEKAQSVLLARLGEAGHECVSIVRTIDRLMNALVIACEENIPVGTRREQWRREHVIEAHFLATPQVMRPRSAITGEQRMEIVYSWCKQFARLIAL